jgi:hypothetical protein
MPLVIVLYLDSEVISLRTKMVLNKTSYSLESGVMYILNLDEDEGHAVSLLRCQDRWYIYDSNNILVECDWYKGDIASYKKEIKKLNVEYKNFPVFIFAHLIYVRDSF